MFLLFRATVFLSLCFTTHYSRPGTVVTKKAAVSLALTAIDRRRLVETPRPDHWPCARAPDNDPFGSRPHKGQKEILLGRIVKFYTRNQFVKFCNPVSSYTRCNPCAIRIMRFTFEQKVFNDLPSFYDMGRQ